MLVAQDAKDRNRASFGWQAFTAEAGYRSYNKRLSKLPGETGASEAGGQGDLHYGKGGEVSANGLNRMVCVIATLEIMNLPCVVCCVFAWSIHFIAVHPLCALLSAVQVREIEGQEDERKKYSRRRTAYEGSTVDHISDKNEVSALSQGGQSEGVLVEYFSGGIM